MNRRQFIDAASGILAGASLAGCIAADGTGDADVVETVVRDVPDDGDDDTGHRATETAAPRIAVTGLTFRRAGQKGLLVAGDVENESDRALEAVVVEVTLYDENETADGVLDTAIEQESRESLEPGAGWQWAATFRDEPLPEIDYYTATARGYYG